MNDLVLGPMLRFVDETSATIWVETEQPGRVCVLDASSDTFSIEGRHYALVSVDGLVPGTCTPYDVLIDGAPVWPPPGTDLPPSVIRTSKPGAPVSILAGSCRAAAPHEPPYTLELIADHEGRGVDTLWAHARRMISQPPDAWPDLLLLVGDQIYADDSSPGTRKRLERRRSDAASLPTDIVAGFEEYCWLYEESWSLPNERWLLSNIPSAMIFDDHDMIDDWNISASWVRDIGRQAWWKEHAVGSLMSYWIYQHLGNLSPKQIRAEGILDRLLAAGDGTDLLKSWATDSATPTSINEPYRFSFTRCVGNVTLIVVDCRNDRVLDRDQRRMVGPGEWAWVTEQAGAAKGNVLIATSVPVFVADGLHDLQVWNERLCDGAWGKHAARLGERLRRSLDLEDWPAFADSYAGFVDLVDGLRTASEPPNSIVVLSGDIHFSYAALVPRPGPGPSVWQVVTSPIRNALIPPERGVMRFTLTAMGRRLGALLRRSVRGPNTAPGIITMSGPYFNNNMCELFYRYDTVELVIEQSTPEDDGGPELTEAARLLLYAGSTVVQGAQPRG